MKTVCICEECGMEFDNHQDAYNHELACFSLKKKQEVELYKVQDFLEQNYSDQISDIKYEVNEQSLSSGDCTQSFVTFKLEFTTFNNDQIVITDNDIESGALIMSKIIINVCKSKIELLLPQEYEGVMMDNSGYGFFVGKFDLDDICSRLKGKKVRIQVIE